MTDADARLFHRGPDADGAQTAERLKRRRTLREAVGRLCRNADFKTWLFATLDDLRLFDRDEQPVDDFGQGFRAAAARIRDRLLDSPDAVDMLTSFAKIEYARTNKALVQSMNNPEN